MTIVRRPSPLGELLSLRQAMDRLFEDSFVRPRPGALGGEVSGLPVDVRNASDALVVEAVLPGIKPEDVEITVEDGTLTIQGEYRDERRDGEGETLFAEIRRGSVSRTISLPKGLEPDKASATFENGVLNLRIPRAEASKPRQIRISPTTDGQAAPALKPETTGSQAQTNGVQA